MSTEVIHTPTRSSAGTFKTLLSWIQTTTTEVERLQSTVHLIVKGHQPAAEGAGDIGRRRWLSSSNGSRISGNYSTRSRTRPKMR